MMIRSSDRALHQLQLQVEVEDSKMLLEAASCPVCEALLWTLIVMVVTELEDTSKRTPVSIPFSGANQARSALSLRHLQTPMWGEHLWDLQKVCPRHQCRQGTACGLGRHRAELDLSSRCSLSSEGSQAMPAVVVEKQGKWICWVWTHRHHRRLVQVMRLARCLRATLGTIIVRECCQGLLGCSLSSCTLRWQDMMANQVGMMPRFRAGPAPTCEQGP
mmetsp:Transcript_106763/g.189762  ORF Transcript_106763/g.189762 Transcript_106763/m.189762 type:complete len:218 (+) Transcript_106763:960-1613(+)